MNRKSMPIRIYKHNAETFNNNGIRTLFPSSAIIERNLEEYVYNLEITHPIDDENRWKEIIEDRIIIANEQPFRIKHVTKTMNNITAYCEHIFFDLSNNFIEDTNIVSRNGFAAIDQILTSTVYGHNFNGTSDIDVLANSRLVRKNVLNALLGDDENSFGNRWGYFELDIDGFNFKMNKKIGQDRGYKIIYGKNLTGINAKIDMTNVVTRIRPVGFDGIELSELYVDSPYINNYAMPIIREYKYEDVKWKKSPNYKADENEIAFDTLEEARAELKRRALLEFSENLIDVPTTTYDINFIELSNTEEYKNLQSLSLINIGDSVTINHEKLGINIPARCISYKYNCLTCNFDEITLGHYNKNFLREVSSLTSDVKDIITKLPTELNNFLQQSKEYVTEYINGGWGGYLYYTPNGLYILDNPDINVAQSVAVLNVNGLGFSNTGINGTFETAITRDGHISASFIDTGTLNAELVKAGVLSSINNKSWINMETGEFNLANKVKYEGNTFQISVSSSDINVNGSTLDEKLTDIDNKIDEIVETGGTKGDDGYSVILTKENFIFTSDEIGNIENPQSYDIDIVAYSGTTSVSYTINTLPIIDGLNLSINNNKIKVEAISGNTLAESGSFDISIKINNIDFIKTLSWIKTIKPKDGEKANNVKIISTSQVFKSTDGGIIFTPDEISLKPILQNLEYKNWEYTIDGGTTWNTVINGTNRLFISDDNTLLVRSDTSIYTEDITSITFRLNTNNDKFYDTITIIRLYDAEDIEIGTRNLLANTKNNITAVGNNSVTQYERLYYFVGDSYETGRMIKGKNITFSFEYEVSDGATGTFYILTNGSYQTPETGGYLFNVSDIVDVSAITNNKLSKTMNIPIDEQKGFNGIQLCLKYFNGEIKISKAFLTLGTIQGDWQVAQEDIDNDINNKINPLIKENENLANRLNNFFSNNVITPYEKKIIKDDMREIDAQFEDITKTVEIYKDDILNGAYNEYKLAYDSLHSIIDVCLEDMSNNTELSTDIVKDAFYDYGVYYNHFKMTFDTYIKDNFDITNSTITALSESVDVAITKSSSNEENLNTLGKHMKFSDDGWLEIFATKNDVEGRFKTRITDSKLSFTDNNNEVAYISNQKLNINYTKINNEMQIGNIMVKKSSKGGIIFNWTDSVESLPDNIYTLIAKSFDIITTKSGDTITIKSEV